MKAIDDFIKRYELSADIVQVPSNPYTADPLPGHRHYFVTVRMPGPENFITTYYSVPWSFLNNDAPTGVVFRPATSYEQEENNRLIAQFGAPKLHDVLDTMAMNAPVLGFFDFEEWAERLGFNPDSRNAEYVYNITRNEARAFQKFLGSAVFYELRSIEDGSKGGKANGA